MATFRASGDRRGQRDVMPAALSRDPYRMLARLRSGHDHLIEDDAVADAMRALIEASQRQGANLEDVVRRHDGADQAIMRCACDALRESGVTRDGGMSADGTPTTQATRPRTSDVVHRVAYIVEMAATYNGWDKRPFARAAMLLSTLDRSDDRGDHAVLAACRSATRSEIGRIIRLLPDVQPWLQGPQWVKHIAWFAGSEHPQAHMLANHCTGRYAATDDMAWVEAMAPLGSARGMGTDGAVGVGVVAHTSMPADVRGDAVRPPLSDDPCRIVALLRGACDGADLESLTTGVRAMVERWGGRQAQMDAIAPLITHAEVVQHTGTPTQPDAGEPARRDLTACFRALDATGHILRRRDAAGRLGEVQVVAPTSTTLVSGVRRMLDPVQPLWERAELVAYVVRRLAASDQEQDRDLAEWMREAASDTLRTTLERGGFWKPGAIVPGATYERNGAAVSAEHLVTLAAPGSPVAQQLTDLAVTRLAEGDAAWAPILASLGSPRP